LQEPQVTIFYIRYFWYQRLGMDSNLLLQNAEQFARKIFSSRIDKSYSFHSISHTESVVKASREMADYYQLSEEDRSVLMLAAWFHDTGYSQGAATSHEDESKKIAAGFLQNQGMDPSLISRVLNCIEATRMPQSPRNLLEQILCDADLAHLGSDKYSEESKLLRKELNELGEENISKKSWRKTNIQFLQNHNYFTEYAQTYLNPVKQQHLQDLLAREEEKSSKSEVEEAPRRKSAPPPSPAPVEEEKQGDEKSRKEAEKLRKEKESRTDRGVGTMFRIMSDNHVSLSQMADSKANIMISVNTIVLSIMVSVLFSKLQYYPQFIIPTIILCVVSLSAIIFAILATRPNVNKGTFNHEDIQQKRVNLLFFGNFFKMELPDYEWAMKEMMNDREYLYGSMIKDIYYLGKVLARKYKFLRLSYNIFMFGLVLAMLAFIIAFIVVAD